MRLGWIGFHQEGLPAFRGLLEAGAPIQAAFTLPPEVAATRGGAADYAPLCRRFHVPRYEVANINDPAPRELLRLLALDVVFVIGWTQSLDPETLQTARIGMISARTSLLPKQRGNTPIHRARIPGECAITNSLVWLVEAVNGGNRIDETEFLITPYDTRAVRHERVATSNRDMLLRLLPQLLEGQRPDTPLLKADGAAPLGTGRGRRQATARPGGTLAAGRWPHPRPAAAP